MSDTEVLLNCNHVNWFYPRPYLGDLVYCHRCDDFRTVVGGCVHFEHTLRLECEGCSYKRSSSDLVEIRTRAETHAIKKGHQVIVKTVDGETVAVIDP